MAHHPRGLCPVTCPYSRCLRDQRRQTFRFSWRPRPTPPPTLQSQDPLVTDAPSEEESHFGRALQ